MDGNTITVTYAVPEPPLVFDTTLLLAQPDMGFSLSGTSERIVDVQVTGASEVTITCSRNIVEPSASLGYGVAHDDGLVGLGNLRDSETALSAYGDTPLPNWALHSLDRLGVEIVRPQTAFRATRAYVFLPGGLHEITFGGVQG